MRERGLQGKNQKQTRIDVAARAQKSEEATAISSLVFGLVTLGSVNRLNRVWAYHNMQ